MTWTNRVKVESQQLSRRDGANRKFVFAVRTASAACVRYTHCNCICCTFSCPRPSCTAIHKLL